MTTLRHTSVPRLLVLGASAVLATATLTACGGSSGEPSGSTDGDSEPSGGTITISGFDYGIPLTVQPGAKVTVVNDDSAAHTVTDDDGEFDGDAPGNATSSFTAPADPGSYKFHCSFHDMHGTLNVAG